MDDVVASLAGTIGGIDGSDDLLAQDALQPLFGEATDCVALSLGSSPSSLLEQDASIEVVPQQAHLDIESGAGDGYSTDFLKHLRPWVHAVKFTTGSGVSAV